MGPRSGIESGNRTLLDTLHSKISGPFTADEAAATLGVAPSRARRLLAYLTARGWLSRVRRGLYALVPLGATAPSQWREDPLVAAAVAFSPCYIGGWSASEHWGLTEQIFRDIVVITSSPIRDREVTIQGTPVRLRYLQIAKHFGTRAVWRGQTKILISDPSRTIVDILDDPAIGGGVRHVADVVAEYFSGEHRNDQLLTDYTARLGNRTVYKRLGYIIETLGIAAPDVLATCLSSMSEGVSALDPTAPLKGKILKRWNLRVNVRVEAFTPS